MGYRQWAPDHIWYDVQEKLSSMIVSVFIGGDDQTLAAIGNLVKKSNPVVLVKNSGAVIDSIIRKIESVDDSSDDDIRQLLNHQYFIKVIDYSGHSMTLMDEFLPILMKRNDDQKDPCRKIDFLMALNQTVPKSDLTALGKILVKSRIVSRS